MKYRKQLVRRYSRRKNKRPFTQAICEIMERRVLLDATNYSGVNLVQSLDSTLSITLPLVNQISPDGFSTAAGTGALTPATIRHAYGFDQASFGPIAADGTGQTIAIVDAAHNYADASKDLEAYDISTNLEAFDSNFDINDNAAPSTFLTIQGILRGRELMPRS